MFALLGGQVVEAIRDTELILEGRRAAPAIVGALALLATAGLGIAADIPIVPVLPPIPPPPPQICNNGVYADAAYLRMTRQDPDATPLVSVDDPDDILDAADFSFGWSSGVQARAGILFSRLGIELGGFWISPWSSYVERVGPFDDPVIETTPETLVLAPTAVLATNETRIFGADANVVIQVNPNILMFGGVAFISLADSLEIGLTVDLLPTGPSPDEGYSVYTWDTLNRMIGPQFGARVSLGSLLPGTFFLGADIRAGLLFNFIQNSVFADRDVLLGDLTGTDTAFSISPMVGAGVKVGFQATSNIALTAGYQALWLGNVALAPDQVAQTGDMNIARPGAVSLGTATNDFFTHGLEIGIKIRF